MITCAPICVDRFGDICSVLSPGSDWLNHWTPAWNLMSEVPVLHFKQQCKLHMYTKVICWISHIRVCVNAKEKETPTWCESSLRLSIISVWGQNYFLWSPKINLSKMSYFITDLSTTLCKKHSQPCFVMPSLCSEGGTRELLLKRNQWAISAFCGFLAFWKEEQHKTGDNYGGWGGGGGNEFA